MLIKYIRNERGHPRAVIVAIGAGKVFWSQCNVQAGDRFSKKLGKKIALGRSKSKKWINNNFLTLPAKIDGKNLIEQEVNFMIDRSKRYFKQEK